MVDSLRCDFTTTTKVYELKDGNISSYEISPSDFDISERTQDEVASLAADSTASSLSLVKQSLSEQDSLAAEIVALNAGASIYVAGVATSLANGVAMAQDAIASGLATERLNELVRISKLMGET